MGRVVHVPRVPFAPIDAHFGATAENPRTKTIATTLGVYPRTIQRWRESGVDVWLADAIATALGRMASEVWGSEWDDAIDRYCDRIEQPRLFEVGA